MPLSKTKFDHRQVWLLARVIELPLVGKLSRGSYPFCHWGVLVTPLPESVIVDQLDSKKPSNDALELGTLYQLSRSPDNLNTLRISHPFLLSELCQDWHGRSWNRIGMTSMSHDRISTIGSPTSHYNLLTTSSSPDHPRTQKLRRNHK